MSSAWSAITGHADDFLLPCPFKYLTGLDCPGCGFQRSLIALIRGNLWESLSMYPPLIPLLTVMFVVLFSKGSGRPLSKAVVKVMYLTAGSIIASSYIFKISTHYLPEFIRLHLQ